MKIEIAAKAASIDAGEADYALTEAALYVDFYTDYFNLSLPLKKIGRFLFQNYFVKNFILFIVFIFCNLKKLMLPFQILEEEVFFLFL